MEVKELNLEKLNFEELNFEELTKINGGSELSNLIMEGFGAFCGAFYQAATGPAIRPSQYR